MVYNCEDDECRQLGRFVQEERKKQCMSQEELAALLGVSRVTVAHMELYGRGLNNVVTRRQLAKALGVSPLALGVLGADAKPEILYDKAILRRSFQLHVENYFTTSTVTLPDIDTMVASIFSISKSLDHKDKDVLKVLHGYTWLGIGISGETLDSLEIEKYIAWSVKLGKELNNPVALARTYEAASYAMYALGEYKRADGYAQQAMNLKNVPSHVHGLALLDAGVATNTPDFIDEAITIVEKDPKEEDVAYVRLSPGLCQIRKVMVMISSGDVTEAENLLADAEESTPTNMLRRQCMLQWLSAEIAMKKGTYDQAAFVTLSAIPMAKQIHSQQNVERLKGIYAGLLESTYATSRNVKLIGQAL